MKRTSVVVGLGVALAWAGLSVIAGPLTPPVGPVMSTAKPLSEIEPRTAINAANTPGNSNSEYVISQPGSYYLTGNITTSKVTAIGVNVNSVTIDLNGFTVSSTSASALLLINAGISAAMNVHDGRLTGVNGVAGSTGITCLGDQLVLRRLSITTDGQGINAGINAVVEDVDISSNNVGGTSIGCGAGAQVRRTAINGAGGITVGDSSLVQEAIVRSARSAGITIGANCTVTACNSSSNSGTGINTGANCTITGCTAASNTGSINSGFGIFTGANCTITGCTAASNTYVGIRPGAGCTISGCTAGGNLVGIAFGTGGGGTITGCTVNSNTGGGISASQGATISNCTVRFNGSDGIFVTTQCLVIGNMCANNSTGSGIYVSSIGNRVEGNNCVGNGAGINIANSGNVIVKNTCSGNTTNWFVAAGNVCLAVVGAGSAFTGNSGGTASGTTDPNANFSY